MGVDLLNFAALFLLIASLGLMLFYREAMIQRITEVINPQAKPKTLMGAIQQTGHLHRRSGDAIPATSCRRARLKSPLCSSA